MTEKQQAQFRNKQQLVALFRAQIELLRRADPYGVGRALDTVPFTRYDDLLKLGPTGRWPSGMLAGLKQGIRDVQTMLDMAYVGRERAVVRNKLREAAGEAIEILEERDAKRLVAIRKRKHIRTEDEYYLVRATIDRLEGERDADPDVLRDPYALADAASAGGAA
jgi:hypothetical protein